MGKIRPLYLIEYLAASLFSVFIIVNFYYLHNIKAFFRLAPHYFEALSYERAA